MIIDANGAFEYTRRSYTLQFVEDCTVVVLDTVKCLLIPKILYGVIYYATCCLDTDWSDCLCLWFSDCDYHDSATMEIQL